MKIIKLLSVIFILAAGVAGGIYIIKSGTVDNLLGQGDVSDEDGDEAEEEERIHIIDGYKAIELDEQQLQTIGISSARLEAMQFRPEFTAYAEALDIGPLVNAKNEFENLRAEKTIRENELSSLRAALKRATALHDARSLSTRELERHRAEVDRKAAELNAMKTRLENLDYKIRSEWGDVIADIALQPDSREVFNNLAMHRHYLVMMSLPKNRSLSHTGQDVFISHSNRREDAIEAEFIGRSKKAGNPLYGESFVYLLESENLYPGMRLFAWIGESSETQNGLFVPDSAIVWYSNEPWVYIHHGSNTFIRKPIKGASKVEGGRFLVDGINSEERVVLKGGQTLLSEEFKWAIPDEDDD